MEDDHYWAWESRSATIQKSDIIPTGTQDLESNPPCNGEQSTRRTHHHCSLVRGLLRESWIRGCSGSRTIPSAGLLDYEDTRLKTSSRVRMGLSLAWKTSLAMRIFKISYHCNRLCVTLTLSGVYINRRVLVRRTTSYTTIIS